MAMETTVETILVENGRKNDLREVFEVAVRRQSTAILDTFKEVFSEESIYEDTHAFRASAARLVAAETVVDQIALTIQLQTNHSLPRPYAHELAIGCIKASGVDLKELDDDATGWWERVLFNSHTGQEASSHIRKVARKRDNPEVAEGVLSEESMMVVLTKMRANISTFNDTSIRYPWADQSLGRMNQMLENISSRVPKTFRDGGKADSFHLKAMKDLPSMIDNIAAQLEPLMFQSVDAKPYVFTEWENSQTANNVRAMAEMMGQNSLREVLRMAAYRNDKKNQLFTGIEHVFRGLDSGNVWRSLTVDGQAATATLLLLESLPVEQKVDLMLRDPMLVKTWAYLDGSGSPDLKRTLSSWREGAVIAYASSKSAEFTAFKSVGFAQRAAQVVTDAFMPRLPSITKVESGFRFGSLVIGLSIASVVLSACGGNSPDSPTATEDTSQAPDLVSLVATHPLLTQTLSDYKISEQCSFPKSDFAAPADYITAINTHLTTAEAAFLNVPHSVDLSDFSLICDKDTGYVYLENSSGSILLPTESGFMEATWVGDALVIVNPTALPAPTEGVSVDVTYGHIPEYAPLSGGSAEISPDEEFQQLRDSLAAQSLSPDDYDIKIVAWPTSILNPDGTTDYRWGSVIVSKNNPNMFLWPRYDDGDMELSIRPDMRPESRPWHYEQISVPQSLGKDVQLVVLFQTGDERQLFVAVDMSKKNDQGQPKVVAHFDPDHGVFIKTADNQTIAPPPADYTGFDSDRQQYFMEADDGYTYLYFEATIEQEAYWARPLIENYYAYDHWDVNAIPVSIWVKYGTPGSESITMLTHRDVTNADDRSNAQLELNTFILKRFQISDLQLLRDALGSEHGIPYNFTFNGTTMNSELGTNGGFQITFVSADELKADVNAISTVYNNGTVYLVYDGVENGKVKVRMSTSKSFEKLLATDPHGGPEYDMRVLIFMPLMNILVSEETDDLKNVTAMRDAGIVASGSADPRGKDGLPDLQIIIAEQ